MRMKNWMVCVLIVFGMLFLIQPCKAEDLDAPFAISRKSLESSFQPGQWDRSAPVDIQSKQMTVDFDAHRIVFLGDVKVTQADFSLAAREVTAIFGDNAEDIKRIIAKGDVAIQKSDKMAWGSEAVYNRDQATLLLRGHPTLKQGQNYIKGEEIRVYLDEERMDIKGDVKAEFRIQEKK